MHNPQADYTSVGSAEKLGFAKEDIKRIMHDTMKHRALHVDPVRDHETIRDLAVFLDISFEEAQKRLQDAIDSFNENR